MEEGGTTTSVITCSVCLYMCKHTCVTLVYRPFLFLPASKSSSHLWQMSHLISAAASHCRSCKGPGHTLPSEPIRCSYSACGIRKVKTWHFRGSPNCGDSGSEPYGVLTEGAGCETQCFPEAAPRAPPDGFVSRVSDMVRASISQPCFSLSKRGSATFHKILLFNLFVFYSLTRVNFYHLDLRAPVTWCVCYMTVHKAYTAPL